MVPAPMRAPEAPSPSQSVFRRRVFYIPGYDPIPPRRYRELYRSESRAQARISGYEIAVHPRQGAEYGWAVTGSIPPSPGAPPLPVEAEVEVLVWSDLVQSSMQAGIFGTYLQLVRTAATYVFSGALFRLMRLRKGPMIAALYPILVLLLQLALALGIGALASSLLPGIWGWALGGGLAWGILQGFRRWDRRIYAWYLMHDYAFSAQSLGANPPELEARLAQFLPRLRAALADCDELLLVGHSSGAHLAISLLADLLRQDLPEDRPALGLLTLGHVVPMVSFLPRARRLRGDLAALARRRDIAWVDVTAPGDGCAFALCDPVSVTGVAPEGKLWPLVLSAAFRQTLSPERWKALRWRFFRLHFQYLCAFDRPGDYDYFQITAGPISLAERFAGRAPSRSRIETPLSGWRET